jgi:hypothetical protein
MKNISTGTGIALLAGAIVAFPFLNRISAMDEAAHAALPSNAARAVADTATAQAAPTIVWYGLGSCIAQTAALTMFRAWSDGTIEMKWVDANFNSACNPNHGPCSSSWFIVSSPNQGFSSAADLDFNGKVDGADLGMVLVNWGDAPRHDIPPSDCPLNLINPK